jgi:diamine N-acetyltransferase
VRPCACPATRNATVGTPILTLGGPKSGCADVSIVLRAIDRDNWHECIGLALTPEQEAFLPSNLFHIAEARFYPEWTLLGVYADNQMVGFAMYGLDLDDGTVNFLHFMIDGKEQGKGYGKAALDELLRRICGDYPGQDIWLSLHPHNTAAIELYRSYGFGFEEIGMETADEFFMCLRIP